MKLTKKSHACIRVEKDGQVLVVDPGIFTEDDATDGAAAILITHEHPDHFDESALRTAMDTAPGAEIWTLRSVAEQLAPAFPGRVHVVGNGDRFEAAGVEVQVYGEYHAVIHPDLPRITNIGFMLEGSLFHPGDALTVPDTSVQTLMVPVMAPWNKASEVIDYVREVGPQRAIDIHDGLLVDQARPLYDNLLGNLGGADHARLASGEATDF